MAGDESWGRLVDRSLIAAIASPLHARRDERQVRSPAPTLIAIGSRWPGADVLSGSRSWCAMCSQLASNLSSDRSPHAFEEQPWRSERSRLSRPTDAAGEPEIDVVQNQKMTSGAQMFGEQIGGDEQNLVHKSLAFRDDGCCVDCDIPDVIGARGSKSPARWPIVTRALPSLQSVLRCLPVAASGTTL